ncbi:MAG: hypothetical protein A3K19_07400 [Lentisphaerae bacterium RIFOXYB12_FULL_65_16]|nr:MAG: hypothetical protein A3K18_21605 [Lentisphaerae bacterium RIFOXYA12_64_32]OGV93366.1 MAG: hypothetical protein A3K19_07400 [Lentisphaerae bacterium RIFOXYB12_FULL_65_16]
METTLSCNQEPGKELTRTLVWTPSASPTDDTLLPAFHRLANAASFAHTHQLRVIRRLGQGRQGVVLAVEQSGPFNTVTEHALKLHDPTPFAGPEAYRQELERIARQVSALQRIHHPNLVQCHEFVLLGDVGSVLMEFIDGLDIQHLTCLRARANRGVPERQNSRDRTAALFVAGTCRWQPGVAFYILRKILRGLDVLHKAGYIHGDIKPQNVMLDRFGTVKLVDFGRAIPSDGSTNLLLGTPLYMAPEVHRRERLTPVSDLYSAGMTILEMLRGRQVLAGAESERELLCQKETLAKRLEDYMPPGILMDERYIAILRRLLSPDPTERFASATEADSGHDGVRLLHDTLLREQLSEDYDRRLAGCLSGLLPFVAAAPDRRLAVAGQPFPVRANRHRPSVTTPATFCRFRADRCPGKSETSTKGAGK